MKDRLYKGLTNPRIAAQHLWRNFHPLSLADNLALFVTSRYPVGTHVLDRDWDLLVILDTCRVDAMRQVAPEFGFVGDVDRIWSRGGSSPDWIAHTFDRAYEETLAETAYLTANPHAETVLEDRELIRGKHFGAAKQFHRYGSWDPINPDNLGRYERLWKFESGSSENGGDPVMKYTPPRVVTDRGIAVMREYDFDRVILHYMQPHYPYISNALREDRDIQEFERRPKSSKRAGRDRVFEAYQDDLRYVLEDISLLLENVSAETVVLSADHGDAFGEYCVYGHGPGRIHPQVRNVPWVETTASDTGTHTPETEPVEQVSESTSEHLEALGYKA